MNRREMLLAAEMLEQYSEALGNKGCNDWSFPDDWNAVERADFTREAGDGQELGEAPPDFVVATLLSEKLEELAGDTNEHTY